MQTEVLAKRQALALAKRQDSLVRALSCFHEAIVLCDLSDAAGWRILYANDAWEKVTGMSASNSKRQTNIYSWCVPLYANEAWEKVTGQ